MEFRELIAFCHVARLRSVSKAADYLDVGQPAVTTRLKKIEKEFDVTLFDRVKRPIQLTSDGTALYEMAKPLIEGLEDLKTRMGHPELSSSFTIGAYPDLALYYLPPIIKEFKARYPDVHIKLLARSYSSLIGTLSAGEVDLALAHRPVPENRSLTFKRLFTSNLVLITPPGHELLKLPSVGLMDIASWPLVMLGPESFSRQMIEPAMRRTGVRYDVALEMTNVEMVKTYVEIGMGISVINGYTLHPGDEIRLGIVPLTHLFPASQIGILTVNGKTLGRAVRNFIDSVAAGDTRPRPSPTTIRR